MVATKFVDDSPEASAGPLSPWWIRMEFDKLKREHSATHATFVSYEDFDPDDLEPDTVRT